MQAFNKIFTKPSSYVPIVAIILGLIVGAIVMLLGGFDPIAAYRPCWSRFSAPPMTLARPFAKLRP